MTAYIVAQSMDTPLSLERQVTLAGTYLTGAAAQWYEQQLDAKITFDEDLADKKYVIEQRKRDEKRTRPARLEGEEESESEAEEEEGLEPYSGPLYDLPHFVQALLQEFEDVDLEATAQHKLEIISMGQDTAEAHIRNFKHWARHSAYNDKALVAYFRRSLTPALKKKVQDMADRPSTLKGWYDQAIKFDRNWREDLDERRHTRPSTNPPARTTPTTPQTPAPTRGANQTQPRTGWRPWGSVAQPAQQSFGVNAMPRDDRCFKCGKRDGHFARDCPTPQEEIERKWGRASMFTPGGRPAQNRATNFANAGEFVNAMSQEQRAEMLRELQPNAGQGFGNGSS